MALFKKGQPKPPNSGRKPGSKNKKTLLKAQVFLAERDFHPVEKIIQILPKLSPKDQADVLLELLQYLEPKRKAQEVPDMPKESEQEELNESDQEITQGLKAVT